MRARCVQHMCRELFPNLGLIRPIHVYPTNMGGVRQRDWLDPDLHRLSYDTPV